MRLLQNNIAKKIGVLMLLVCMLVSSAEGRIVRAASKVSLSDTKEVIRWERRTDLKGLEKGKRYPVIIAWENKGTSRSDSIWYTVTVGEQKHLGNANPAGNDVAHPGYYIAEYAKIRVYTETTDGFHFIFMGLANTKKYPRARDTELAKSTSIEYLAGYRVEEQILIESDYFYTDGDIETFGIATGLDGADGANECQLYTKGIEGKGSKITCHDGHDSNMRIGYDEFEDGRNFWTLLPKDDRVCIYHRDDGDNDWIGFFGNELFCESVNDTSDGKDTFYLYVGIRLSVSTIGKDMYIPSGQLLNIDNKKSGITILEEGCTLVIEPGATVIVKGIFWCNGSIENYGTLILDKNAVMCSAWTTHDGACMVNCYGPQASVANGELANDDSGTIRWYAKDAWMAVHDGSENGYIENVNRYRQSGKIEGNFIILSGASYIQNQKSHKVALLGGAQLISHGSMVMYDGFLMSDSVLDNTGYIAFGFGVSTKLPLEGISFGLVRVKNGTGNLWVRPRDGYAVEVNYKIYRKLTFAGGELGDCELPGIGKVYLKEIKDSGTGLIIYKNKDYSFISDSLKHTHISAPIAGDIKFE